MDNIVDAIMCEHASIEDTLNGQDWFDYMVDFMESHYDIRYHKKLMNPFSTAWNIARSIGANLRSDNPQYLRAALDIFMLYLPAMPAYIQTESQETLEGPIINVSLFSPTFALPYASIPFTCASRNLCVMGLSIVALNLINITGYYMMRGRVRAHEANHLFDTCVLLFLEKHGFIDNALEVKRHLMGEPPYRRYRPQELPERITTIVSQVPGRSSILA
jgi:hypothetical protein